MKTIISCRWCRLRWVCANIQVLKECFDYEKFSLHHSWFSLDVEPQKMSVFVFYSNGMVVRSMVIRSEGKYTGKFNDDIRMLIHMNAEPIAWNYNGQKVRKGKEKELVEMRKLIYKKEDED